MLYRKSSPTPPTLLLRIVTTASGLTGVLGVVACGSSPVGSLPIQPSPDAGDAAPAPCGGGVCGITIMPPDAGDDATGPCSGCDAGIILLPEAGDNATGPCDGHVCGVIVAPDAGDAADDRQTGVCGDGGVCGILIMPDAGIILMPPDAGEE